MARVIFIQQLFYEYGGPQIISSVLKAKGHDVKLLIGNKASFFFKYIKQSDIIAFPTMTGFHHWVVDIAYKIKKKTNCLIVLGGPHPTYFPEVIEKPGIDVICRGEGEYAMLDLVEAVESNKDITSIPNLWVKKDKKIYKNELRPLIEDLNGLPFPDRDIYYRYKYLKNNPLKTFMSARGCPYKCTFCFNSKLQEMYKNKGSYVRTRSPENIINELVKVKSKYGLKKVFFADDIFVLNKIWLRDFIDIYKKEVELPFTCDGRADVLDEETIRMLKEGGCYCIRFGIESGNEDIRNKILKKNITNDQIRKVAKILKSNSIKFMTYNMVGIPEEKLSQAFETIKFNIDIKTDYPRCSLLTPYPGTEIAQFASSKKLLVDNPDKIISSSQQGDSLISSRYKNGIVNIHSFFQTAVIFPRSLKFIKILVKLPPNPLFKFWWAIVYFFVFIKAEGRSFWHTLLFALRSFKTMF